jgi:hypothetical protein
MYGRVDILTIAGSQSFFFFTRISVLKIMEVCVPGMREHCFFFFNDVNIVPALKRGFLFL